VIGVAPSNFRIFAGPQVSFLTKASFEGADVTESFEQTSYGIRYGFGILFNSKFTLQVQSMNGLTDIYLGPDTGRSNSIIISVGYTISNHFDPGKRNSAYQHRSLE
jgi:hypothetical protein